MLESYGTSDPGCVRTNNEDFFLLAPALGLYLVADGMGGAQAGEQASRIAAETVAEYIYNNSDAPKAEALVDAFQLANQRVLAAASEDASLEGMGTTLVAAYEDGDSVVVASVGDSRAYAFVGENLIAITEDQTWVQEVGRRLGLDEESLRMHPMRHVLTMAVGVGTPMRVHSYTLDPVPGTQFLLCSDGLHGVVDAAAIAETLNNGRSLEAKCHSLVETARRAGGPDNITAVLLRAV
ncbi:MAG: serine/threonine-protein phosphatase [Acidobacteria bacterium]|nr:serine/threonine-protein phosphatase [Acidobacteriota bacterium]